jgi:hypothetical protein
MKRTNRPNRRAPQPAAIELPASVMRALDRLFINIRQNGPDDEARIVIQLEGGLPFMHDPNTDEKAVRRAFPTLEDSQVKAATQSISQLVASQVRQARKARRRATA